MVSGDWSQSTTILESVVSVIAVRCVDYREGDSPGGEAILHRTYENFGYGGPRVKELHVHATLSSVTCALR